LTRAKGCRMGVGVVLMGAERLRTDKIIGLLVGGL
jgi:hypothetical protein